MEWPSLQEQYMEQISDMKKYITPKFNYSVFAVELGFNATYGDPQAAGPDGTSSKDLDDLF